MEYSPEILNTSGLLLGIIGVLIIFIWGPPQPEHSTGISLGLEDATPINKSGKTVAEHNKDVEKREKFYSKMSRIGLLLIMIGFAFQLVAIWTPERKESHHKKQKTGDISLNEKNVPDKKQDR